MSDKFEECTLGEATHVEVNGKVYLLGGNEIALEYYHGECIGLGWVKEDAFIPKELLPVLGIKTFKEIKPEPIEFEAVFAEYNGMWHPLYNLDDNYAYQHDKKAKFKCVEILEDEK